MADGSVVIDTKLDKSGFKTGLAELGNIAAVGVAAAVTAISALGVEVVKTGAAYEKTMSGVNAVSGATEEQMKLLSDAAMQAGKDTVFSSAEAAQGMEELLKSGLSVEQVLNGGLTGALSLAAAGEIGVADAAEVASTVLNSFRDDNLSVADAANILAGAANASATDVAGLQMGLAQCSAVASGMGMSFEDTTTALATFAQNGLKGSDAGTSLKTMLMNLQPVTDKQAGTFKKLGLLTAEGTSAFYDATGSMKPLNEIAGLLQTSMSGLTDAERAAALEIMFGSDAVRAGNIMFKEGAKGVEAMNTALNGTTAAEVAAKRLDNLTGDVEFLTGSLETLGIGVYQGIQAPLRGAVGFLTDQADLLLSAFNEGGIGGLVDAAGTVLSNIVSKIVEFAPKIIDAAVSLILSLIDGIVANMDGIAQAAVQIAVTLVEGIISAAPKLIEGGIKLVAGLAQGLADALPTLIPALIDGVISCVKAIIDNAPLLINAGIALLQGLVTGITSALPTLIAAIPVLITGICNFLTQSIPLLITAALQLVQGIIAALPTIIAAIVAAIPQIITAVLNMITTLLPQIIQAGIDLFMALIEALPDIINQLVLAIPKIINSLLSAIVDLLPVIIDAGVKLFMALVNALPEIIAGIVGVLPVILASLVSVLLGSLQQIIEAGLQLFLALVKALPEIIIGIVAVLPQIITSVITALLDSIPLLIQCGIDLLMSLIEAMPDIIVSIVAVMPTLIQSIITALLKALPQIIDCGIDLFMALIKALPTIIKSLVAAMPQIIDALVSAFGDLKSKLVEVGKNLLHGIWEGLLNAKDWLIGKVKELLGEVTDSIKKFFGISSPSKLFENVIGKNLMLGLVEGIEGQSKTVGNSMAEIAQIIAGTNIPAPTADLLNGVDTGDIYRKVVNTVDYQTGSVAKVASLNAKTNSTAAGTEAGANGSKDGKPSYVEATFVIDGKEAGKAITPYVEKELAWRDK